MILAGADGDRVRVYDTNDPKIIFKALDEIDAKVVYILTNTYHAPEIKAYFKEGGASNA